MPTYQYRCTTCDNQFEVRQSFTDEPISVCVDEGCDGEVKKVFGNVGIAFKGSGFYKNDSRSSSKQSDSSGSTDDKKTSSKTSDSSTSTSGSSDKSAKTDTPKKASD
ncbi:MAG: FmdB family zinc ribbon protein [Actinomycetota bacterium]|nr:FmdB family zinc ribbon protein [Actinomycetota bacterium]